MPNRDVRSSDDQNRRQEPKPRLPVRVIAADDDPTIRLTLARMFDADRRFVLVGTARDGREAVEVVTAHRPDVVVLDVSMPHMDGIEAAAAIHLECPEVLIAMCSSDRNRRSAAFRAGAELWIDKPFAFAEMSSRLLALTTNESPSSRLEATRAERDGHHVS